MAVLQQNAVGENAEAQRRRSIKLVKDVAGKLVICILLATKTA